MYKITNIKPTNLNTTNSEISSNWEYSVEYINKAFSVMKSSSFPSSKPKLCEYNLDSICSLSSAVVSS